jgi:hypothetical protein
MDPLAIAARFAGWTVPPGYVPTNTALCRGCGQIVLWTITPHDRKMPIDRDGVSHFATCPRAADFRRRRSRSRS